MEGRLEKLGIFPTDRKGSAAPDAAVVFDDDALLISVNGKIATSSGRPGWCFYYFFYFPKQQYLHKSQH